MSTEILYEVAPVFSVQFTVNPVGVCAVALIRVGALGVVVIAVGSDVVVPEGLIPVITML